MWLHVQATATENVEMHSAIASRTAILKFKWDTAARTLLGACARDFGRVRGKARCARSPALGGGRWDCLCGSWWGSYRFHAPLKRGLYRCLCRVTPGRTKPQHTMNMMCVQPFPVQDVGNCLKCTLTQSSQILARTHWHSTCVILGTRSQSHAMGRKIFTPGRNRVSQNGICSEHATL